MYDYTNNIKDNITVNIIAKNNTYFSLIVISQIMKPAISINTNLDPNSLQSQPSNSSSSSMYNNDRPF